MAEELNEELTLGEVLCKSSWPIVDESKLVEQEKEIVLIVVQSNLVDNILHALYNEVGLNSAGQGIAFALPVDHVVGIATDSLEKAEKPDEK